MKRDDFLRKLRENKKKTAIIAVVALLFIGGSGYAIYSVTNQPKGTNADVTNDTKIDSKTDKDINDKSTTDKSTNNKTESKNGSSSNDTNSSTDKNKTSSSNKNEKKDTSTSTNKPSSNNSNSSQQPSKPNKPVEKPSTPNKPVEKPSKPSTPNKPVEEKPSHSHKWEAVYKTVHHKEEGRYETVTIKEAWTEQKPIYEYKYRTFCNYCEGGKLDITDNVTEHTKQHLLGNIPGGSSYRNEKVQIQTGTETINHPAVTEKKWVVTKPAWSEKVVDYYKCSCGAKK